MATRFHDRHTSRSSPDPVLNPLQRGYAQKMDDEAMAEVRGSLHPETAGNKSATQKSFSFVEMIQVYGDATATNLEARTIVTHPVHIIVSKFRKRYHSFFMDHALNLLPYFPFWRQRVALNTTLKNQNVQRTWLGMEKRFPYWLIWLQAPLELIEKFGLKFYIDHCKSSWDLLLQHCYEDFDFVLKKGQTFATQELFGFVAISQKE